MRRNGIGLLGLILSVTVPTWLSLDRDTAGAVSLFCIAAVIAVWLVTTHRARTAIAKSLVWIGGRVTPSAALALPLTPAMPATGMPPSIRDEGDSLKQQLEREQNSSEQARGEARSAVRRAQDAENQLGPLRRDYEATQGRIERYQHAVKTLVTWLYRRDGWHGLSQQGQNTEAAPWDIYAQRRYQQFGLGNEAYERTNNVGPEPGWTPPEWSPDMIALYLEGSRLLRQIRGFRVIRDNKMVQKTATEAFAKWDDKAGRYVAATYGHGYWDGFLAPDDLLSFQEADSQFPEWVRFHVPQIDRRLTRLRWLADEKPARPR